MKYKNEIINQNDKRSAGVLLHIASLPGAYGIGTFGKSAYEFVDFLKKSGVHYWQVLPLVQTGFGDSPYQSVCCNSGNPYFIDPDILVEKKLLTKAEAKEAKLPFGEIDYAALYNTRYPMLRKAFSRFDQKDKKFQAFVKDGAFNSYAEYMTLKNKFGGRCFADWDDAFKFNDRAVVEEYVSQNKQEFLFWVWLQFEFYAEWSALKKYANKNGVFFIGDIPLYVAYDSSDVWSKPELFKMDEDRRMTDVAGVPPDYFSATGQLWGNPLYDWEKQKKDGYSWWIERLKGALTTCDVVRIDHFRGLDRYYAIPNGRQDAIIGEWCDGPKRELFDLAKEKLGEMNVIAEDLGILDDGVIKLLNDTAYPGMKILLFAFEGGDNPYLPKNINYNSICYTGTHDNDTSMGYFKRLDGDVKKFVKDNIKKSLQEEGIKLPLRSDKDYTIALQHLLFNSKSCLAIVPLQDLLFLDNTARMNTPGTSQINWKFRIKSVPSLDTANNLKTLLKLYNRK